MHDGLQHLGGVLTDLAGLAQDQPGLVPLRLGSRTRAGSATTQTTHYRYAALGRRIDKSGEFGATRFGWDGDLLSLEIRGSKQSEYLYEPDSFVPLAKLESAAHVQRPEHKAINPKKVASLFKATPSDSEQKEAPAHASQAQAAIETEVKEIKPKDFAIFYYQCDQIGAPQELTDEQGHIVWAADYKVWGRTEPLRISATGTDDPDPHDLNRFWPGGPRDLKARSSSTTQALNQVEQNLRFQGQYFDHESGLHYNRFRYYDPQTGRFVHQDPIGLWGGFNVYFFGPNLSQWADPLGLARFPSVTFPKDKTIKDVTIKMQGSRKQDFNTANKEAGILGCKGKATTTSHKDHYGEVTWHHVDYDPKTNAARMQLVTTADHVASLPHGGSVSDFEQAHGVVYESKEAKDLAKALNEVNCKCKCQ